MAIRKMGEGTSSSNPAGDGNNTASSLKNNYTWVSANCTFYVVVQLDKLDRFMMWNKAGLD